MIKDPSLTGRLACMTAYACQYDPRFSYYVYVPRNYGRRDQPEAYRLIVLVHGTERSAERYRDQFRDFANQHEVVIMAPLFPAGHVEPDAMENYRSIKYHDLAYDRILLNMVEEIAQKFPVSTEKFLLHGFSSGGQFAHRFFYLHPERLMGVSIGAPGEVTYPRPEMVWPEGLGGLKELFGREFDPETLKRVPVQVVVGDQDVAPRPTCDQAANRLERAGLLKEALANLGVAVRQDVVPGAGHEGFKMLEEVMDFFSGLLESIPVKVL